MWMFSFFFPHFLLPSSWTKMPWRQCCAAAGYYYIHVFWMSAHYNQKHGKKINNAASSWPIQSSGLLEQFFYFCQRSQFLQKLLTPCKVVPQNTFSSSNEIPILRKRASLYKAHWHCKAVKNSSAATSVSNTYNANALTKPVSWSSGTRWVWGVIRLRLVLG